MFFMSQKKKLIEFFKDYREQIQSEVLAVSIEKDIAKGYKKEWNINGETVVLGVEKV